MNQGLSECLNVGATAYCPLSLTSLQFHRSRPLQHGAASLAQQRSAHHHIHITFTSPHTHLTLFPILRPRATLRPGLGTTPRHYGQHYARPSSAASQLHQSPARPADAAVTPPSRRFAAFPISASRGTGKNWRATLARQYGSYERQTFNYT